MSMQVAPAQGQPLADPGTASPAQQAMPNAADDMQPAPAHAAGTDAQDASGIPQALNVCCNGNYGVYLLARRGVQCMCLPCQAERAAKPSAAWVMSPTEFERHSGMPTAKKWRMSIKVAHQGEPELPLGRWLELKGISQTRAMRVSTSPDRTHEQLQQHKPQHPQHQQQPQQLQKPKPGGSGSADSRDTTDAVRPCASSLARVLLQGLARDQSGQVQGQLSRPGTPQRTSSSSQQQQQQLQESHRLSAEPPHFSSSTASGRGGGGFAIDVAAQLRSCFPSQQAGVAAVAAAAARMETARVAAYAAAAAEAEAAAAQAQRRASTARQQQQPEQGSNDASPNAGRSSSSSQGGGIPRPSPPNLLHIPCPTDAPPRPDEPAAQSAAATYQGADPVPLEEAAAAAARGDDSLWLRSPMCRTPGSARQGTGAGGAGGSSRLNHQEAVAAEAFRRLISAHLHHPKGSGGGSGAASGPAAGAAAAALLSSSLAGSRPSAAGDIGSGGGSGCSMDTLLAAAAAATAAEDAAAAAAAGGDDGDCNMRAGAAERGQQGDMGAEVEEAEDQDEEAGICVGPEHQADLPLVRPLPGFAAAVALMELKKSGLKGPGHEEALRLALEEKARSDLLPRDAVEDVWERAATGLALERAQRHRKPPGWQAGYVDPLKPLTAQQQQQQLQALEGSHHNTPEPALNTNNVSSEAAPDSARHRKRGGSSTGGHQLEEALLLGSNSKKLRCNGSSMPPQHPSGLQASRFGPGAAAAAAAAAARGRRVSLDGTPAGCCSEPGCPSNAPAHTAPRAPPNGFWGPLRQPAYTAPVGPELLSWVLMVPPAAAAAAPAPPLAPSADGQQQAATPEAGSAEQAGAAGVADAAANSDKQQQAAGSNMDVDATAQQQQQAEDAEMADAAQDHAAASAVATTEHTSSSSQPAGPEATADAAARVAAAAVLAPEPPLLPAAAAPAAAAAAAVAGLDPSSCLQCLAAQGSAVEVRIVLDGCVFMGRLQEVSRLEMARSRVGAAVEPIKQAEVHRLPPAGATCVLCHAAEAPGSHMDQAKALRSSGLSSRGLGPLMPVCMPPLAHKQAPGAGGNGGQQLPAEGAAAAAAIAGGGTAGAAAAEQQGSAPELVWVHRQCALWSPEVFPDRSGMLMHLPGAIRRGRATRCSHCGQKGATLKCAEQSCAHHFHLACARGAGCTLIPEPYAIGCPAHEPKLPEPPAAAVLSAFPGSSLPRPLQEQQQQPKQQQQQAPEHPQLPVLRCRTTRHRAPGDVGPGASGTPLAGSRAGDAIIREGGASGTPLYPAGGSPMHVDSCGLGGDSEFLPSRAGSEDRDMLEAPGSGTGGVAGYKRSRGGQSRLRRQTNTDWADAAFTVRPDSPAHQEDATPTAAAAAAAGRDGSAKPSTSRGAGGGNGGGTGGAAAAAANNGGGNGSTRGSYGSTQLHDSRGRFMSHAAAQLLASGFTSTPTASVGRARSVGRGDTVFFDAAQTDSRGGTPAMSDGPGYSTPRCGTAATGAGDADGNMSDVSSGAPLSEATLGGTTGQPGRAGRCAVCVVQRKGKCGTESAPKKCLRRMLQEQQQAERAKRAAPMHSVAAAASAVAIAAAEAEALAASRGSPALRPSAEPTSATAMSALALAAAEAEALVAARNSPALRLKQEPPGRTPAAAAGSQPGEQQEQESQLLSQAQALAAAEAAAGALVGPKQEQGQSVLLQQLDAPQQPSVQQQTAGLLGLRQLPAAVAAAAGLGQLQLQPGAAATAAGQEPLSKLRSVAGPVAGADAAAAAAATAGAALLRSAAAAGCSRVGVDVRDSTAANTAPDSVHVMTPALAPFLGA